MAHLGSKTTDNRLSFVKYVTENKRFSEIEFEIEFEIEKGKSTVIYTKNGTTLTPGTKEFTAGTKLKITDKKVQEISNMKLAAVQIGVIKGFIPINVIRKPTSINNTKYEDDVVNDINKYILESGGKVDLKLKGDRTIYKDISYAVKVDFAITTRAGIKGAVKADIILCKDNKNPTAAGSIYISHKKEGSAEAFQQYGGLSEQAGEKIYNHPLVQKFLGEVANIIGNSDRLPNPVLGEFKDDTLANMSIYGTEYGSAFSLQHVQIVGQGKPVFKTFGEISELSFTNRTGLSGDISQFTGDYLPVFGATFRSSRGFTYKNKRYNRARVAIYPYKFMIARRNPIVIKVK